MGESCCQAKSCELSKLKSHARILWAVLGINLIMFGVEAVAGWRAESLALTGDSLDMLGDAVVYAGSLYVIHKSDRAQAGVAFLKGLMMVGVAIGVFARASYQVWMGATPEPSIMGSIGLLALGANLLCLLLLTQHREDNLNMSSVWLCSRNDIIANTSVLGAATLVAVTDSMVPDLVVGALITIVFAQSAGKVLSQSWQQLQGNEG